jgi:uncharacterized damage-inducible protein DinB
LDPLWLEAFRYNRWANQVLIDACAGLDADQLQLSAPGTYGTIAATLQHLVAAEHRYVMQLGGAQAEVNERDEFPGIARLAELAAKSGDEMLAMANRIGPGDSFQRDFRGHPTRVESGVVVLQCLHHGNDHRTHVCTILGQNGIEVPPIDVWSYGLDRGFIVTIESPSSTG